MYEIQKGFDVHVHRGMQFTREIVATLYNFIYNKRKYLQVEGYVKRNKVVNNEYQQQIEERKREEMNFIRTIGGIFTTLHHKSIKIEERKKEEIFYKRTIV